LAVRISADKDDPGYPQFNVAMAHGKRVVVLADGVEVKQCVTADEELRYVKYYQLDGDGNVQIDPCNPDQILTAESRDCDVKVVIAAE